MMTDNRSLRRERRLGACRDLVRCHGYTALPAGLLGEGTRARDWVALQGRCAQTLKPDPYVDKNYCRALTQYVVFNGEIVQAPSCPLTAAGVTVGVNGVDTGRYNPENSGGRVFSSAHTDLLNNPALRALIFKAIALDPVAGLFPQLPYLVQVFLQTATVDEAKPTVQAAPPDVPHNDGGRFKLIACIGRHNVSGGTSYILPRALVNQPFTPTMAEHALAEIAFTESGQGYAFLDDLPRPNETREANCHYVTPVTLDQAGATGYRCVATLTPVPLLPAQGLADELDAAYRDNLAVTSGLIDTVTIINNMPERERARVVGLLR